MKMFAALRKEDLEELRGAEQAARKAIDNPEEFARRLKTNAIFADLYQNDRRMSTLRAK